MLIRVEHAAIVGRKRVRKESNSDISFLRSELAIILSAINFSRTVFIDRTKDDYTRIPYHRTYLTRKLLKEAANDKFQCRGPSTQCAALISSFFLTRSSDLLMNNNHEIPMGA